MALIFIVSGTPREEIPQYGRWDILIKKGGHLAAYALLTLLWLRALSSRLPTGPAAGLALGIALLYAISDEYHQTFVPGRNGTGVDVLVDMVGGLVCAGLWYKASRGRLA
jgi:VanZ family protein